MAVSVKQYRTYKCTSCGKTCKTVQVLEGLNFGNPLFQCSHCGAVNYDKYILEPAFVSKRALLENEQKVETQLFPVLCFFSAVSFLLFILLTSNTVISAIIAGLLVVGVVTHYSKKKKAATIDNEKYQNLFRESIQRLASNPEYFSLVSQIQGIAEDSVWKETHR